MLYVWRGGLKDDHVQEQLWGNINIMSIEFCEICNLWLSPNSGTVYCLKAGIMILRGCSFQFSGGRVGALRHFYLVFVCEFACVSVCVCGCGEARPSPTVQFS